MTNVHARMLVPGSKRSCAAQALSRVSWTRSSARSGRPQSPRANARKCGMTPVSSRLKLTASAALRSSVIRAVELVQQLAERIRKGFLDDRIVEPAQARSPVGRRLTAPLAAFVPDVLHRLVFRHPDSKSLPATAVRRAGLRTIPRTPDSLRARARKQRRARPAEVERNPGCAVPLHDRFYGPRGRFRGRSSVAVLSGGGAADTAMEAQADFSASRHWFERFPRALPVGIFLLISAVTLVSVTAIESTETKRRASQLQQTAKVLASALERRADAHEAYL